MGCPREDSEPIPGKPCFVRRLLRADRERESVVGPEEPETRYAATRR